MIIDINRWRDQQLDGFKNCSGTDLILEQELIMLNFVKTYSDVVWRWLAPNTKFKKICQKHININNTNYNGIIIFGSALHQTTTQSLVNSIKQLTNKCDYAYVAINRYQVRHHDLHIAISDKIDDSLDIIMNYCNPKFQRLHTFDQVDGNHMVAAHPMDCYGLCK
jgi:hypothetical protein